MLLEENFKSSVDYCMRDPILFGDYRTALDESEPRLYEDIQDYDAAKALFQEVSSKPDAGILIQLNANTHNNNLVKLFYNFAIICLHLNSTCIQDDMNYILKFAIKLCFTV